MSDLNDMMKVLLGFDPDEVVEQARTNLRTDLAPMLEAFDSTHAPEAARVLLRSLLVSNMLLAHQVAALVSGGSAGPVWPATRIYEALREEAGRLAFGARDSEATE